MIAYTYRKIAKFSFNKKFGQNPIFSPVIPYMMILYTCVFASLE